MVKVAERGPNPLGLNVMLITQLAPEAREFPQVFVSVKSVRARTAWPYAKARASADTQEYCSVRRQLSEIGHHSRSFAFGQSAVLAEIVGLDSFESVFRQTGVKVRL